MEPVSKRKWVLRGTDDEASSTDLEKNVAELSDALDIGPLTAKALALRGFTDLKDAKEFLSSSLSDLPDPFLMKGMDKAVERLVAALGANEQIAVHGDYDVDGVTGSALLVECLQGMGADVKFHIPDRLKDGYGLSADALKQCKEDGCTVAISVDCGVSAINEAKLAEDIGIDLIITDHHQPPDNLPNAVAIINPHCDGCQFPFKELSGVGVAFFLMIGLRKALRETGYFKDKNEPDLRMVTDLVALGTVADIVPLKGVNRTLTKYGLDLLSKGVRPGIVALKKVAGVKEVTSGAVGFKLGPRLNAAGRVDSARQGTELLLMDSSGPVDVTAETLDALNNERRRIEAETLEQAINKLENEGLGGDKTIVLFDKGWHPGVIGIVASRLVERYNRPTVLIAVDEETGKGKGSARSIKGFHLFHAFQECADHLAGYGGHEFAAGLSIELDKIPNFIDDFEAVGQAKLTEDDMIPRLPMDGEVLLSSVSLRVIDDLAYLAPYGMGNPEPTFIATRVTPTNIKTFGEGGKHLSFYGRQGQDSLKCVAFGMGDREKDLQEGEVDILFAPDVDEYRGLKSVRCMIKDIRSAK